MYDIPLILLILNELKGEKGLKTVARPFKQGLYFF